MKRHLDVRAALAELAEPPGAEKMDVDRILRHLGYSCVLEEGIRYYEKRGWHDWTLMDMERLLPVQIARNMSNYLLRRCREEGIE